MLPSNNETTMSPKKQQQMVPRRCRRILPTECLRDTVDFLQLNDLLRLSSVSWLFYGAFLNHSGRFKAMGRHLRTVIFDRDEELEEAQQQREMSAGGWIQRFITTGIRLIRHYGFDAIFSPAGFHVFLRLAQSNGRPFAFVTVPKRFSSPPEEFVFGQIRITVANNAMPDLTVYNQFIDGAVGCLHDHFFLFRKTDYSKLNKRVWELMEKFQRFRKALFEMTENLNKISAFLARQWVKDTPELCFIVYRIDSDFSIKKWESAIRSLVNWLHLPPNGGWPEEVDGERTLELFIYGRNVLEALELIDTLVQQLEQKFLIANDNAVRKYRVLIEIRPFPCIFRHRTPYQLESVNHELFECRWEVDGQTIVSRRPSGTPLRPFAFNVDRTLTRCLEFNYSSRAY